MIGKLIKTGIAATLPLLEAKTERLKRRPESQRAVIPLLLHDVEEGQISTLRDLLLYAKSVHPFITPLEFDLVLEGKRNLSRTHFLLTFDDGFASNFKVAQTVLQELEIKAVFFVCPGFVGLTGKDAKAFVAAKLYDGARDPSDVRDTEVSMEWEDIRWLAENGHEIGSHTRNHVRLSTIQDEKILRDELQGSADEISREISRPVRWLAYPFGDIGSINAFSLQFVSNTYKTSFSGIRGINTESTNPYALRRECVQLFDSPKLSKAIIHGGLSFSYKKARQQLDDYSKATGS